MKGLVGIASFLILGILTAVYIGYGFQKSDEVTVIDEELVGANKKIVIRFSHVVANNTPKGLAVKKFAQLVNEKTDGWVEVQVYPNGMLYSAQGEFNALMKGEVQMISPASAEVTVYDPKWFVMDLPYLFSDEDMVDKALDGEIGEILLNSIGKKGYKGLAFWDNGFKQRTSAEEPILLPDDLEGLRVRVMHSDLLASTYRQFNAYPEFHDFNAVYSLLSTGEIDATENTLSNIYSKGFHRVQKHLTISDHGYLGYVVLTSEEFWQSLPDEYRKVIQEAMDEVTVWQKEHAREINEYMLEKISASDKVIIHKQSDMERAEWEEAVRPIYKKYEPMIGSELMEAVRRLEEMK